MRGNEHAALVGFKHHFKEMLAIEAKDRTPVGSDVADCGELVGQLVRTLQTGHDHDVVHFAYGTVFLVDGADFRLDEELRLADAVRTGKAGDFRFQRRLFADAVEAAVVVIDEVTPQLVPPCRMGEIARGHDGEAFDHTPCRKIADIEPAAGGAGKARMDMQICAKVFHVFRLAQKRAESQ